MQVDAQDFLSLAESAPKGLCSFDIEATGLNGDYNSALVVSVKPFGKDPMAMSVDTPGNDESLIRWAYSTLKKYTCWVSYYGKGFDVPMLQARAAKHGLPDILLNHHHVDLYYVIAGTLRVARKSQAHLLRWLDLPEKKMDMSPEEWNQVLANPGEAMPRMIERCKSDTVGLESLYRKVKRLVRNVTR